MNVYITEQGSVLSKEQGKLLITKGIQTLSEIPLKKIEKINIMGNIGLTTPIINYFLENNIEVVFMTQAGKYRGKLIKDEYRNVLLRLKQYEKSKDNEFQLKVSKWIVKGKLRNYYEFISKKSKYLLKGEIGQEISALRVTIEKADKAETIDKVRGYEGIGSRYYFDVFRKLMKNSNFKFEKRVAHPPTDPVNSMLSFGYTLLYNEIAAAMNIVGLDPYLGNLHTIEVSKKSLLFDMVEEWRNIIVDDLVLKIINRNEIKNEDFEIDEEDKIVRFKQGIMRNFIAKYETNINQKMRYHLDNEENYIRTIFEKQMRHYARVVLGEEDEYMPFKISQD